MSILNEYRKNLTALKAKTAFILTDHNFEKFSEEQVEEAINDAAMDFSLRCQCVKDEINILVEEDRVVYDVKAFITAANNATPGTNKKFGFLIRVGLSGVDEPSLMPSHSMAVNFSNSDMYQTIYANRFFVDLLSPGKLQIMPPSADGEALPSEDGNIQVFYVGLPDFMDTGADYPDAIIPPQFHDSIATGAAAMLLYEGDEQDLLAAQDLDMEFKRQIMRAVAQEYEGQGIYQSARPV